MNPEPKDMKTKIQLPSFMIKDDQECRGIAVKCGLGTRMSDVVDSLCQRTGKPHNVTAVGTIGERVYVLQYFSGYDGERQNGWLAYGYDSVELYLLHLPHLIEQLDATGNGPYVFSNPEAPCNN